MRNHILPALQRNVVAALCFGIVATTAPVLADSMGRPMQGMSTHMMGQGMMGSGTAPTQATSPPDAGPLIEYVDAQHLTCFACHAISKPGTGPSFEDIARRYAGSEGAANALTTSIVNGATGKWSGYRAMPGGLATTAQAERLAQLIMALQPPG